MIEHDPTLHYTSSCTLLAQSTLCGGGLAEHGLCRLGSGLGGSWNLPNAWPCREEQCGRACKAVQVSPHNQIDKADKPVCIYVFL